MDFQWYKNFNSCIGGNVEDMNPEDIAECIKRIRADYIISPVGRFWPLLLGPRIAHVYICEPLSIKTDDNCAEKLSILHNKMNHYLSHI